MELKKLLGKNIKKYRKQNGITQEKLAEKIGVEVISISFIETGRYFPSPSNLVKISEALQISLAYLFTFDNEHSCDDYISEITRNIDLMKNDIDKLVVINSFIKTVI